MTAIHPAVEAAPAVTLAGYRWHPVHVDPAWTDEPEGWVVLGYSAGRDERDGPDLTLHLDPADADRLGGDARAVVEAVAGRLNREGDR